MFVCACMCVIAFKISIVDKFIIYKSFPFIKDEYDSRTDYGKPLGNVLIHSLRINNLQPFFQVIGVFFAFLASSKMNESLTFKINFYLPLNDYIDDIEAAKSFHRMDAV